MDISPRDGSFGTTSFSMFQFRSEQTLTPLTGLWAPFPSRESLPVATARYLLDCSSVWVARLGF
ncbi:hypothetical protein BDW62DRAFT_192277 [Aspergillus aurantiobrunneus]